jgi:lipid II:glycine glycyltransferase (peptidoglycan interpeptide bridge formation enzyme)
MEIIDIRQTENWSKYLEMYKWKSIKLSNGAILRTRALLFFKFAKLQRPGVLDRKDLEELDSVCKQNRVFSLKLFPNVGQDTDLLEEFGYKQDTSLDAPPKTLLIDLRKSKDELWDELTKGCRYSINRANRYGVFVAFLRNPGEKEIEDFRDLVSKRGSARNYFVQSTRDYKHKVDIFGDQSFIVNVYDKEGDILGAKLYLGYGKNVAYVHGGTSTSGQTSKGGYKLLWDSILYFKELGFEALDLEGLYDERLSNQTKGWKGYSEFKLKFGGEAVEFPLARLKRFIFRI